MLVKPTQVAAAAVICLIGCIPVNHPTRPSQPEAFSSQVRDLERSSILIGSRHGSRPEKTHARDDQVLVRSIGFRRELVLEPFVLDGAYELEYLPIAAAKDASAWTFSLHLIDVHDYLHLPMTAVPGDVVQTGPQAVQRFQYQHEVDRVDRFFGDVVEWWEDTIGDDNSMVAFFSDHGEPAQLVDDPDLQLLLENAFDRYAAEAEATARGLASQHIIDSADAEEQLKALGYTE